MRNFWIAWLCLFACGCSTSTPPEKETATGPPLEHVKLGLNWLPEAEHGGYFAALEHGYFAEEGLDVEIIRGGPESPIIQQVATGERDFGVANADNVLFGRAQRAPVVAVMAPLQTSPRCLLVHDESPIRSFDDLHDVTLAMSVTQAFSHYLRHRLPLANTRIVPYSGSLAPFLADPNMVQQGYVISEPYLAQRAGCKTRNLKLADLGFNPYTSLLVTRQELIQENRDLVARMTRACVRGWQKYLVDPEPTSARIHELNPQMNLDTLAFGADEIRILVLTPTSYGEELGSMAAERWETLGQQIVDSGQLKNSELDTAGAFDLQFLPAPPERLPPAGQGELPAVELTR